jgi:membrane associated rhomboid family serine protease
MFLIFSILFIPSVAHDVHIAGLVVGILFGMKFREKEKKDADYSWRAVYNTPTSDPYDWIDNYR